MPISVVDIFAGPGGLGEGFSSLLSPRGTPAFRIAVSAEMEANAARTLRLRAFYRQFPIGEVPKSYYDYVSGRASSPWTDSSERQWRAAEREALQLTLGDSADDQLLYERTAKVASSEQPWVLIGGPPCQAYSLVGRARNSGIAGYKAEEDHRHFLYKHYLQIVSRYQPTAFIMENVKGILSSKVAGDLIFSRILEDLQRPGGKGRRYRILPLVDGRVIDRLEHFANDDYIVRAEALGVPQARHRVILFGLAEDLPFPSKFIRSSSTASSTVRDAIEGLPRIRSAVTDASDAEWPKFARRVLSNSATKVKAQHPAVAHMLRSAAAEVSAMKDPGTGSLHLSRSNRERSRIPKHLHDWLIDPNLHVHLNHEARGHMTLDLERYAFASAFATVHGHSPRGHHDFPEALAPAHGNWMSGKFVDRFKVQTWDSPSSTVTSHLAKDGHYFIHPDVTQMRSLSVREAARLQTFPDNYFFEGPRGAQFRQVGNAVPPMMARQIAEVVYAAISP